MNKSPGKRRFQHYPATALAKLPYVQSVPRDGRVVPLSSFFDCTTEEWHTYVPHKSNELIRMAGGQLISGSYLALAPADAALDFELPLGTLIIQHLSFEGPLVALGKLENDIHRCATILEKYHMFWAHRSDRPTSTDLVESELEYLLLLLRSYYDLLQVIVRDICLRIIHLGKPTQKAMDRLPDSFAKVALDNNVIRQKGDLVNRYNMPEALAEWYSAEADFFRKLRELRDGIAHHGRRPATIFETESGFAIVPSDKPWNEFDEWPKAQLREATLGSLRRMFAGFILHSLEATTRLTTTVATFLRLPPALSREDCRLFVRSPFGQHLVRLETMHAEPWEGE